MRVTVTGRHLEVGPDLHELVQQKLSKLTTHFGDTVISVQVMLAEETRERVAELTVHLRDDHMLHSQAVTETWRESIVIAVDRILHQADKVKTKWAHRRRTGSVGERE